MLAGKTISEAMSLSGEEMAGPLCPLPPVKIHCAQLVEGALRSALSGDEKQQPAIRSASPTLIEKLNARGDGKVKVVID